MGILDAPAYSRVQTDRRFSRAGLTAMRGFVPVADHCKIGATNQLSNGTDTLENSRVRCIVMQPFNLAVVRHANFWVDAANGEVTTGVTDITVSGSIEHTAGTVELTWNGATSVVLKPGAEVQSDPVALSHLGAADSMPYIWARTTVQATSGGKWLRNLIVDSNVLSPARTGEGMESGTALSDKHLTGSIPGAATYAFGPSAILGNAVGPLRPITAVVGDSIGDGQNDTITANGGNKTMGFISRALTANLVPHVKITAPGDRASAFMTASFSNRRRRYLPGCTHGICQYGVNDLRRTAASALSHTADQVKALLVAVWNDMARSGLLTWQTTITPFTSSTDSWATLANQTAGFVGTVGLEAQAEANRVAVNDWIRAGAPLVNGVPVAIGTGGALTAGQSGHPLAGYFEVADAVESGRNSGKWKVNGSGSYATLDGLHPSTPMHLLMQATIDTTVLTV